MTGEMLSPIGKLSFEDLINIYKEQINYLKYKVNLFNRILWACKNEQLY